MAEKKEAKMNLEDTIKQIIKTYGEGAIMKLGDRANVNVDVIPSGSIALDYILGVGGYPKGRVIEIYGPESSGKTTFALHAIAEVQKQGGKAAFIDAEHAIDPLYAQNLGVNIDELILSQPDSGEQALEIAELLAKSERTQNHEIIMRYLMYVYTGIDYGVTDFDFSMFDALELETVGEDIIVHTQKCDKELVINDVTKLKKAFRGYSGGSELAKNAQYFLDMQNKYKVNAIFAAAVSITETGAGRAGNAVDGHNNWFNIQGGTTDRWRSYSSPKGSIMDFGDLIANSSYYFKKGNYTVATIGEVYCPDSEVAGQAGKWVENTIAFMTQMYNAIGIDLNSFMEVESSGSTVAYGKIKTMINWAEKQVGKTYYLGGQDGRTSMPAKGYCAGFVSSCYQHAGFGYLGGNANSMNNLGKKHSIKKKKNGKIDWSEIPIGACIIANRGSSSAAGQTYGHVVLYVGNGQVIEAGVSPIRKVSIDRAAAGTTNGFDYWAMGASAEKYINSSAYKKLVNNSSGSGTRIVSIAKTKLGFPYVWGTQGPNTFDCSGFVLWVHKRAKIKNLPPRSTSGYPSYNKYQVSLKKIQPGDVLWRSGHVGIYIGNNKYIHASNPSDGVKISPLGADNFTRAYRFY